MAEQNTVKVDYETAKVLQEILIESATNNREDNESKYQEIRLVFKKDKALDDVFPQTVKENHSLAAFRKVMQSKGGYKERREYIWNEFKPLLERLELSNNLPPEKIITEALKSFDSEKIHLIWQNGLDRKDTDPEGAITLSRTLLESVCKYILDELNIKYDTNKIELPELYKTTSQTLNIAASQHTEEVFKQILGGCSGVVTGLGTLRNRLGDAHGKGKNQVRPAPRHAELAINLAGSMALFLVQTYKAKK
jgi:Abortive infection C-terminus